MRSTGPLPIDDVLDSIAAALADSGAAVLRAPPGAGKTTRVPLALLNAPWLDSRRVVMLEPRRLAARAAAARMAWHLGESVGGTVGYRMRMDTRVSARTRIEVVTEGVLTRMLQHDPALASVGLVIFDEFHERSIHADLGLALTLQSKALFRPDLRILIMSATIEGDPVAGLLGDAPVIVSEGRAWPVATHWLTARPEGHVEPRAARAVLRALDENAGDILVFLPGAAEIRRTETILRSAGLHAVDVYPLFGQLPQALQDRALAESPAGRRKVVLATSIAETSLTIEGVRIVIDTGLMRVPRFSPRTGMSRLETVRVTRAAADQRRGRAGRTAPGVCYRLWTPAEEAGLVPHRAPEILETDVTPLALDLAEWGVADPTELAWLDPPPEGAWSHAVDLLRTLHAIDANGAITAHGREIAAMGVHPRLAHMMIVGARAGAAGAACILAAILSGRDLFTGEHARSPDLRLRVDAARAGRDFRVEAGALDHLRRDVEHWRARLPAASTASIPDHSSSTGLLLALAYPDRIAQRRGARPGSYLMRNGRGAVLEDFAALGNSGFITVGALDDTGREARVLLAAPLERADMEQHFASDITTATIAEWDDAADGVRVIRTRALGSIILEQVRINTVADASHAALLLEAVARRGLDSLPFTSETTALLQRARFARSVQPHAWPDVSDDALLRTLDAWLAPFVQHASRMADLDGQLLDTAVRALVGHDRIRDLDRFAPAGIEVPSGSLIAIDYSDPSSPVLAVRIQELFGLAATPRIAGGAVPLTLHLLSPARRPVQVTRDLAGFWARSYFDVRKDLRGRYPKHPWPDDPLSAPATRRTRSR